MNSDELNATVRFDNPDNNILHVYKIDGDIIELSIWMDGQYLHSELFKLGEEREVHYSGHIGKVYI